MWCHRNSSPRSRQLSTPFHSKPNSNTECMCTAFMIYFYSILQTTKLFPLLFFIFSSWQLYTPFLGLTLVNLAIFTSKSTSDLSVWHRQVNMVLDVNYWCCLRFQGWQSIQWHHQHHPETPGAESGQSLHRLPGPGGPDRDHRQVVLFWWFFRELEFFIQEYFNIFMLLIWNMQSMFLLKYFWDKTFCADIFKLCKNALSLSLYI